MSRTRVLITGAYGLIGNVVYARLAQNPDLYDVYGLARRRHPSKRVLEDQVYEIPDDKFHLVELSDREGVHRAVQNMDVVVHMAADASGAGGWESILNNNIISTYHVFDECRLSGVRRVIFASSIQVSAGYRVDEPYRAIFRKRIEDMPTEIPVITHERPTRPMNLYSSSKVWGEALAHVYAYRHGMSCICLRIGWVLAENRPRSHDWCSQRDIAQLVERCITAPESVRFDIFYGVSENQYRWIDIEHARQVVGYVPQDNASDF